MRDWGTPLRASCRSIGTIAAGSFTSSFTPRPERAAMSSQSA